MSKNTSSFASELKRMQAAGTRGMEKAVTILEADTKLLTHVETGNLRRSWTHSVESEGFNIEGAVGSNLEYAPYEDDLHGNLSTALNTNIEKYCNVIAKELKT